jgi:hypothetical protein
MINILKYNRPYNLDQLPISSRLIISIYDRSENWVKPYIKAKYPVMPWDYTKEGDIFNRFSWLMKFIEEECLPVGYIPYGLFAAPPCTAIAAIGAKHWQAKDTPKNDYPGFNGKGEFSCELEEAKANVEIVWEMKAWLEDMIGGKLKFWSLENPRGRMDTICPFLAPYRKMRFDPCEFGDPYKKETWLWGEFNSNLQRNPVPVIDNKVDRKAGWSSIDLFYGLDKKTNLKYKNLAQYRNRTPRGFANAFFKANP